MDFLIRIVKNLAGMNLGVLFCVGIFIVFLVLLILKGSILQTWIRIFAKKKYSFYFMILPTFLSILTNMILLFISYIVLTKNNIDILELALQYLFNSVSDFKQILYIIIAAISSEVLFLIIQAFILKLINFDLYKSIKNIFVKGNKSDNTDATDDIISISEDDMFSDDAENISEDTPSKLSFINGLLAGIFCFSIMFFLTVILLYMGSLIGSKFIAK